MKHINLKAFDDLIKITYKNEDIFLIHNFFNQDTLDEIKKHLSDIHNDESYWGVLDKQENLPRRSLIKKDDLIEEIIEEFSSNEYVSKINSTFNWGITGCGGSIWYDHEGYNIKLHVDNDRVKFAIQIYLKGFDAHLGTSFSRGTENDIFLTLPYKENFGYCMKNVDKFQHGLIKPVPKNFDRYSLYSILG